MPTPPSSKDIQALRFEAHEAAVYAAVKYQRHPVGVESQVCESQFVEWFIKHARLRNGWCMISQLHDSWHVGWGLPIEERSRRDRLATELLNFSFKLLEELKHRTPDRADSSLPEWEREFDRLRSSFEHDRLTSVAT
jgi:hypothetical protein